MADSGEAVQKYQTDHDLLVRLDERYGAMHQDIKDMRAGLVAEIAILKADVDSLKLWRSGLVGAYALAVILMGIALAVFT